MIDVRTAAAVLAERSALHGLGAGCHAPVGALASVEGGRISLRVRLLAPDGSEALESRAEGGIAEASALGHRAAAELLARGGGRWLVRP